MICGEGAATGTPPRSNQSVQEEDCTAGGGIMTSAAWMVTRPEGGTECALTEPVVIRVLILRPRGEIVGPHNGGESREEEPKGPSRVRTGPMSSKVRTRG